MAKRTPRVDAAADHAALDALASWLRRAGAPAATHRLSAGDMARIFKKHGKVLRARLLAHLDEAMNDPQLLGNEEARVAVAKIAAALLPDSVAIVGAVLQRPPTSLLGELQFSLFVFLSDAPQFLNKGQLQPLQQLVEHYLLSVRSRAAQAAWMAGDLLGDHWPLGESLPILLRTARLAKYAAGREGALHGLAHAIDRASKREQWTIVELLKTVARTDRNPRVRRHAAGVLGPLRGV
jgi:hypothetical protein